MPAPNQRVKFRLRTSARPTYRGETESGTVKTLLSDPLEGVTIRLDDRKIGPLKA